LQFGLKTIRYVVKFALDLSPNGFGLLGIGQREDLGLHRPGHFLLTVARDDLDVSIFGKLQLLLRFF
jgi:hypothetical protein